MYCRDMGTCCCASSLQVEKDWHLMLVILAFVIIDVITLTVVIALPKDRYHAVFIKDRESSSTTNVCEA